MKESWMLYDYLRRWWLLLLLGSTLGAVIGLGYYSNQVHPAEYAATAELGLENPRLSLDNGLRPPFTINLAFNPDSTEEGAIKAVNSTVADLADYTDSLVVINDLSIDQNSTDEPWWKAVVLGSVVGILLAIGWAYVWEDTRAYQRRRQAGATNP